LNENKLIMQEVCFTATEWIMQKCRLYALYCITEPLKGPLQK